MIFTSGYNLPCLGGEDYAAYALYMQCLGEQLDAEFTRIQDGFESFLQRPAAIWTEAAPTTAIPPNTFWPIGNGWNVTAVNWPTTVPSSPNLPALRGWWYIGACVNLALSGASTGNSQRLARLTADPLDSAIDAAVFFDNTYESGTTNGENLTIAGTFRNVSESTSIAAISLDLDVFHGNTASDLMTTSTPATRVWAFFLGEQPELEVVT